MGLRRLVFAQVLSDIGLPNHKVRLGKSFLRLAFQLPAQACEADARAVLKLQAVRTERLRLNRDGEIACCIGRIDDVKGIYAGTGCDFEAQILDVHADPLRALKESSRTAAAQPASRVQRRRRHVVCPRKAKVDSLAALADPRRMRSPNLV